MSGWKWKTGIATIIAAGILAVVVLSRRGQCIDLSALTPIWPRSRITAHITMHRAGKPPLSYTEKMQVRTYLLGAEKGKRKVFRETYTVSVSGAEHDLPPGPYYSLKLYDARWRNRVRFSGRGEIFDLVRAATGDWCVLPSRPVAPGDSWHEEIGYGNFAGKYEYTFLGMTPSGSACIRCCGEYDDLEQKGKNVIGRIDVVTTFGCASDCTVEGKFFFSAQGIEYAEQFDERRTGSENLSPTPASIATQAETLHRASVFFRQKNLESAARILENYLAEYPDGEFAKGAKLLLAKAKRDLEHRGAAAGNDK